MRILLLNELSKELCAVTNKTEVRYWTRNAGFVRVPEMTIARKRLLILRGDWRRACEPRAGVCGGTANDGVSSGAVDLGRLARLPPASLLVRFALTSHFHSSAHLTYAVCLLSPSIISSLYSFPPSVSLTVVISISFAAGHVSSPSVALMLESVPAPSFHDGLADASL